ncbi:uncharacterized protein PHACADRAFT_210840 [Phanerochaete carnosa HHB-10118-sp]|uniref:FAD-binding PCMH-type domain-containing protein n=1 Tax=Phanerochaete carnosa (strain HHB-10118-sp) TaxID=650164 RepID=K5VNS5_PHACS|nr:uncharacterized protein PHACADRAFT_210840 [Phanerochaete carnosa HHB-10118-sp]EKM53133.1 hypothetical protein PHACADRAFT_210840 [Phanerochaete carnosa HHB-10118-sp]
MANLNIQGKVLTPASGEAYTTALTRLSELSQLPAGYIVQPSNYADVAAAVKFAQAQSPPFEIAVKGGGAHSATWASSSGGVVIDLGTLRHVAVAPDRQSIVVQGGALWGDVYEVTAKEGLDVAGGSLWFVGVGGLRPAVVVLADGRIVKTSKDEEPDLFWAIRGGSGKFGVVVEFVFKLQGLSISGSQSSTTP